MLKQIPNEQFKREIQNATFATFEGDYPARAKSLQEFKRLVKKFEDEFWSVIIHDPHQGMDVKGKTRLATQAKIFKGGYYGNTRVFYQWYPKTGVINIYSVTK